MFPRTPQTFRQKSSSSSTKLSTSTAQKGNLSSDRVVKKRASRACQCCRERKVRCNIVEYGPPCTNCRLDNVTCIAAENKRKTKHIFRYTKSQDQVSEFPDSSSYDLEIPGFDVNLNDTVRPTDTLNFELGAMNDVCIVMNEEDKDRNSQYDFFEINCQAQVQDLHGFANPSVVDLDQLSPSLSFDLADFENHLSNDTAVVQTRVPETSTNISRPKLPSYLEDFPQHLTDDETNILLRKSAFSIPENALRNKLLQAYIEYVHPCIPLINIHELLNTIQANGRPGRISLMLFQAVMFAGTAFISMDYLHAVGFANRREAQNIFYQRCRILYDIDYETDYIALIQSLILMTYCNHSPDDPKGAKHWLDIAISLAYRIGLNRTHGKSNLDQKKQSLLKRLWWSCLMRDRFIALETKGLVAIKDSDFDIPPLALKDFEIEFLPRDNTVVSPDFSLIRDKNLQTELALICIEQAKLCLCIGHLICVQYPICNSDGINKTSNPASNSSVVQPWRPEHVEKVLDCDFELSSWLKNLPWGFSIGAPLQEQHILSHSTPKTVLLHRSLLHILHCAALSALHEPQSISVAGLSSLPNGRDLQDLSLLRVYTGCKNIASIGLQLHTLDLTPYLPTTAVAILIPAIARHLSDLQISLSSPPHPHDDFTAYDTCNSDFGESEHYVADDEEDDLVSKQTGQLRSRQCVQLLESLQYAFPTTAACHAIRVLGVAAAVSSPAGAYRSDVDLALALATRNVRRRRRSEMSKASKWGSVTERSSISSASVGSESVVGSRCSFSSRGGSIENISSCSSTQTVDETHIELLSPSFAVGSGGSFDTTPPASFQAPQCPGQLFPAQNSSTKNMSALLRYESAFGTHPSEPPPYHQYRRHRASSSSGLATVNTDISTHLLPTTSSLEGHQYPEDERYINTVSPNSLTSPQSFDNPIQNPYYPSSLSLNYSVSCLQSEERPVNLPELELWKGDSQRTGDEIVFMVADMHGNKDSDLYGIGDRQLVEEAEEVDEEEEGGDCCSSICSRSECADFGV